MQVLAQLALHAADPQRIAVREVGPGARTTLTYQQLEAQVNDAAAGLRNHLRPGEVAIVITGNRAEFFVAALSVWAAGGALLPLHPSAAAAELDEIIRRTGARLLIREDRCEALADLGPTSTTPCDGPSLLLQSSGTTGLPKIAIRQADAIDAVARNVAEAAQLTPADHIFAAIPICHSYGIENAFLAPIFAGSTVHLCDGLDIPEAVQQFAGNATVFPGVPFMFECLAHQPAPSADRPPPSSLRLAYSAGAMLPPQLSAAFASRFGVQIGQLYGASELGSLTFSEASDDAPSSVGVPMSGVRILILDPDDPDAVRPLASGSEGLVAVNAPSMLSRYLDGEAPICDGFFLTGDLGRIDSRSRLFITGRLKNLIDIGGTKVNPAEVELTLQQHPGVAECVVVAIPVTQTISRLKAIVTPSGAGPLSPDELRAFARERLAGYKVPRIVEVRDSLPRSPSGKILRRELEAAR
jgi:acyl-CoA synthetase (AMP-forming)/AMP-acid ligase II